MRVWSTLGSLEKGGEIVFFLLCVCVYVCVFFFDPFCGNINTNMQTQIFRLLRQLVRALVGLSLTFINSVKVGEASTLIYMIP